MIDMYWLHTSITTVYTSASHAKIRNDYERLREKYYRVELGYQSIQFKTFNLVRNHS